MPAIMAFLNRFLVPARDSRPPAFVGRNLGEGGPRVKEMTGMHEVRVVLQWEVGFTRGEVQEILRASGAILGMLAVKWVIGWASKRDQSVPAMADAVMIFARGVLESGFMSASRLRSAMANLGLRLPSEIGGASGDDHYEIVKFFQGVRVILETKSFQEGLVNSSWK